MIARVHEDTMASGFITSLASHGNRRTRSGAPCWWARDELEGCVSAASGYKARR
jgi:hypothetical protein